VVFKPTASGSRTATVTITDSAAGSPHTVPLTGTADSGASAQGSATATLAPASLTFSGQAAGSASSSKSVTLTNGGGAPLTVASIALTGAASGDFTQTNTCGSSVAAGANCSISVVFKPTASGSRTATVTITDGAAGSPHSVPLTGTTDSGTSACKSTVNGAIAYADLKSSKVSLPYGTPFVITGGIADVQLAGGALSTLIAPQTVAGDYNASDGVQGAVTASSITGTSWNFNVGKLSPDTSVVINFQFTGPLSPAVVQTVLKEVLADPAYTAASTQFVQSALGRPAAEQIAATTLLSQSAAAVVTAVLKRMGLTPKNPDDLKAALGTTLANTIPPIFNLNGETSSVLNPAFHVAEGVNLSADALKALPTADLVEKLKTIDYSKTSAKAPADQDTQAQVKGIVDQFLATYQNAVGGLGNGLQAVLFTGSSSLAVGSDQATDVVCDLQKYAGFDVGALYSFRLNELRSFAMVHVYFGPVQLKTGGAPPKSGRGEGLRQRASLAFGMALKDLSGSTQSKISGENAFIYGVGIRLNKYFRLTAGGLLYRTTLPAANGSTSPANGSLRHEFFIGPSIDVTALPALQSIFAKAKSN
jgi:hypothetical protein